MGQSDWKTPFLVSLIVAALAMWLSMLGGWLLFAEQLPDAVHGLGLLLILLIPKLVDELLKERPTPAKRK